MLNIETHRQVIYNIIQEIFSAPFAKHLAFKWGTAAYFLHGLDRFSTDIDLDVISPVQDIDQKISNILKKYGDIKQKSKIILSYASGEDNIKIDINRKIRKNNKYEIVNFFGNDIQVQDATTIYTNKLVALTERNTNRDIYDVYFFMKNSFTISEALIKERTWGGSHKLLQKILKKLEDLSDNYKILDGLGEVLNPEQKSFVKNKLIKELIGMMQMKLQFSE